jgi:hypothetical protein
MSEPDNQIKKRTGLNWSVWKTFSALLLLLLGAATAVGSGCSEGSGLADLVDRVGTRVFRKKESRTHRRKEKLYGIQPYILSFTPTAGPTTGGTVIEIHGLDFFNVPRVEIGFTDVVPIDGNTTYFRVVTEPHPAGIADIVIHNANNHAAVMRAAFLFYDGTPPAPVITAVDPPEIPWGFGVRVSINGLGFREDAKVYFNDVESNDVFVESCTRVISRTPFAGTGPVEIKLVNPDNGCASVTTMFEYEDWSSLSMDGSVLVRRQYRYAEDTAAGLLVAFGGYEKGYSTGYGDVNMTWTFDGSQYVRDIDMDDEPSPSRFEFAFASEPGGGVLLFGGFGDGGDLADTWTYSTGTWQQEAPAGSPTPRAYCSAALDSVNGKTILFGGSHGFKFLSDTWSWDGSSWQQVAAGNAPSPRRRFALAADEVSGGVVLFGGETASGHSGETWVFDGADWTLAADTGPSPRVGAALAFDGNTGKILLFGGASYTAAFSDTWLYDTVTATWAEAAPAISPSARLDAAIAADHTRGCIVLHGGFRRSGYGVVFENDTWEWSGSNWTNVTPQLGP